MSRLPIEYLAAADAEIQAARAYYHAASKRAYESFVKEIFRAIDQIADDPKRWPLRRKSVRYFPLNRFPYLIVYELCDSETTIVALQHMKRRPGYWKKRLREG